VGTPLAGVLVAKTGTLGGVSALSGYVGNCTFSMFVNNAPVPASVLREALDAVALAFGLDPRCGVVTQHQEFV
jgi:D-alanyl-D-alanine carboxypeptidase